MYHFNPTIQSHYSHTLPTHSISKPLWHSTPLVHSTIHTPPTAHPNFPTAFAHRSTPHSKPQMHLIVRTPPFPCTYVLYDTKSWTHFDTQTWAQSSFSQEVEHSFQTQIFAQTINPCFSTLASTVPDIHPTHQPHKKLTIVHVITQPAPSMHRHYLHQTTNCYNLSVHPYYLITSHKYHYQIQLITPHCLISDPQLYTPPYSHPAIFSPTLINEGKLH